MNLLLVEPSELAADGTCALAAADRRTEHVRRVLGAGVGATLKAGIVGGPLGTAEVIADAPSGALMLRVVTSAPAPPPLAVELVLAIPRPKVIARAIETCAAFAVRRVALTNAWRVDKSYLRSPKLAAAALAQAARLGAEQGATTHVPPIDVHERLMGLLDARFAAPDPGELRLLAHPGAPPIERALAGRAPLPCALAIGPEGGWIARELDTLEARGFIACSLGAPILRVESAIAAALGQLLLLDRLR